MKDHNLCWLFVEKYFPDYHNSEEIARNNDLLALTLDEFEDGDSASKLLDTYEWADIKNPLIEHDFRESCLSIFEQAITAYMMEQSDPGNCEAINRIAKSIYAGGEGDTLGAVKYLKNALSIGMVEAKAYFEQHIREI